MQTAQNNQRKLQLNLIACLNFFILKLNDLRKNKN